MEKRRPHYPLRDLKVAIKQLGADAFTKTAVDNGRAMGLTVADMLAVIDGLTQAANFYKSMTTHADSSVWQDVYHADTPTGTVAYIKLTQAGGRLVVQFKER